MVPIARQAPTAQLGFDPAYLPVFEEKLFIEGPQEARRLMDFFALLVIATVIATRGVLSDSTTTAIGATIVAPLMGPVVATTAATIAATTVATILGSIPRAMRAIALVAAGVGIVVIFSHAWLALVPDVMVSFTENGEITSRVNPHLYALLAALGAGAAGAFITSRSEIADSIGGVAIAISLVPPLCVVGIALQQGQYAAAAGALLLFMTNFLAILLAGGAVRAILGLSTLAAAPEQALIRQRGSVVFAAGIVLMAVSLAAKT